MKKIIAALALISVLIFPAFARAITISDGAIIKTADNPDVYIVKYNNGKQFRRLILNPKVFESYGHLKWENIKLVTGAEMNSYKISNLVKVENDPKVLALASNGDAGSKSWLNVAAADFVAVGGDWDSVYQINAIDASNYNTATDLTTQNHVQAFLTSNILPTVLPAPIITPTPTPTSQLTTYTDPPSLNQLTRLIRMCSASPDLQATCENPIFMPGYYTNLVFRSGIDALILKYESVIFNELNQNIESINILPPISLPSYVFSSPPPMYTPPPVYYIPPTISTSTNRIDFFRDPMSNRIYSSSSGTNYFYDLNGRLDHTIGANGTVQINYDLNGNINSINY